MVPLLVLLLIAVAVLLFLRPPLREHLSATLTIKAPPYDQAEKERIHGLVPGLLDDYRRLFVNLAPNRYTDGEKDFSSWVGNNKNSRDGAIIEDLADQVATAYSEVYRPATEPLTTASFNSLSSLTKPLTPPTGYVVVNVEYGTDRVGDPLPVPTVDQIKPLRLRLLRDYFEVQASARDPTRTLKSPGQMTADEWDDVVRRVETIEDIYASIGVTAGATRPEKERVLKQKLQELYDNVYAVGSGPLTATEIESYVNGLPSLSAGAKSSLIAAAKVYLLYSGTTAAASPSGPTGPASDIQAPNPYAIAGESPYSAVETNRIATLVTSAVPQLKAAYARQSATGLTDEDAKTQLAIFIGRLYTNVYATSTPPISEAQIKAYVDRSAASFLTEADRKGLVDLGVTYFHATPTPATAAAATGATGGATGTTETTTTASTGTARTWRTDGSGILIPTRLSSISTTYESPYSTEETNRILNLSPRAKAIVEKGYQNVTPPDGVTKSDLVARYLAVQVAKFYENYYSSLAAPLTLESIGVYIEQTYPSSTSANQAAYKELLQRYYLSSGQVSRTDSTFTELDSNADDALSRGEFNQYIANEPVGGSGTGGTGAAGGGAGSTVSSEFERSILAFRTALVNYKLTGNPGFKTQADTWKEWIDKQIQEMKDGVTENTRYVQDFLTQYETSDQDLRSLQAGLHTIRQTGPELQSQYETEKKAQAQEPLDFSQFYTKSGTLLGILAVVAGASLVL